MLLVVLGTLASSHTTSTINTGQSLTKILNNCASNPDAAIHFLSINMVMHASSDASYLSDPKSKIGVAEFFYLSIKPRDPTKAPTLADTIPPVNGAIHVFSSIMTNVMTSDIETEMGGLYKTCQDD